MYTYNNHRHWATAHLQLNILLLLIRLRKEKLVRRITKRFIFVSGKAVSLSEARLMSSGLTLHYDFVKTLQFIWNLF